jgi:hypothetical protein
MNDTAIPDRNDLIRHVQSSLPEPVETETAMSGAAILTGGDPREVIVKIAGKRVSVGIFTVRWDGPHTPVVYREWLATLHWKNLPASELTAMLLQLISKASELRRARYRKCDRCAELNPPEWMHDKKTCQSCAERHLGVVY